MLPFLSTVLAAAPLVGIGRVAPDFDGTGALHLCWQHPLLEGSAVAQGAGFAGEHRDVMPGVVERVAAVKRAGMLGDDPTVLADYDAIRIGMNFDRSSDRARNH